MPLSLVSGWIPGSLISVSFSAKSIQHISVKRNAAAKHAGVIVIDGFDPNLPLSHRGQKRNLRLLVDAANLALAEQHAPRKVVRPAPQPIVPIVPIVPLAPAIVRAVGGGVVGKVDQKFKQIIAAVNDLAGQIDEYGARKTATVHGLLVAGPTGTGKSWALQIACEKIAVADKLRWSPDDKARTQLDANGIPEFKPAHEIIKGTATAWAIYAALARRPGMGEQTMLDDCDGPLRDPDGIRILLAATDSYEVRPIDWREKFEDTKVSGHIDYQGAVAAITNLPLWRARGNLKHHIAALADRFEIFELPIYSRAEMMEWIRHVGLNLGMLAEYGLSERAARECVDYLDQRIDLWPTLRLLKIKIARRHRDYPDSWRAKCDAEISPWGAADLAPALAPLKKKSDP